MSRIKSRQGQRISLNIHDLKFTITDDLNDGKRYGRVSMLAERRVDGNVKREMKLDIGLLSAWQYPHKNAIVKAHMVCNMQDGYQKEFMSNLNELGEIEVDMRESRADGGTRFSLMADGNVVRFGRASSTGAMRCHTSEIGRFNIYESKSSALLEIIRAARSFRTIGGYDRVNFSKIPNEVLESVGFCESPDILKRGVSMWYGDPDSIGSGGDSWTPTEKENRNRLSFLEMIQSSIQ